jgi:hypothetical protein
MEQLKAHLDHLVWLHQATPNSEFVKVMCKKVPVEADWRTVKGTQAYADVLLQHQRVYGNIATHATLRATLSQNHSVLNVDNDPIFIPPVWITKWCLFDTQPYSQPIKKFA